ncbi:MAG: hypothetical protein ACX930_14470 [Erythrobacter sp.]
MINRPITFAFVAALALAGCTAAEEEGSSGGGDAGSEAGATPEPTPTRDTDIAVSESGWLTVGTDGAVQTTFFDADGRYRDLRNGELFGEGNWQQRPDGKVCFEPDSGRGACWETDAADENGEANATDGDGKTITIKRITYVAPPEDQ